MLTFGFSPAHTALNRYALRYRGLLGGSGHGLVLLMLSRYCLAFLLANEFGKYNSINIVHQPVLVNVFMFIYDSTENTL